MSEVFISYRRETGSTMAMLIKVELEKRGFEDCFLDVTGLSLGHFDERLLDEIERATFFVLVLSPKCLDRCKDPNDWLRREIRHGITMRRVLVPIILPGFDFNESGPLPSDISDLPRHNALPYAHDRHEATMANLAENMKRIRSDQILDDEKDLAKLWGKRKDERNYVKDHYVQRQTIWKHAAASGSATAQWLMGRCYADGHGVSQSDEESAEWFRLAADQELAAAQNSFGMRLYEGKGVPPDAKRAVKLLELAAEQGYASAMHNLGLAFEQGHGVKKDEKLASIWFQRAAENGNAHSQFIYGTRLRKGQGVSPSDELGLAFLKKAAEQGNLEALAALGREVLRSE